MAAHVTAHICMWILFQFLESVSIIFLGLRTLCTCSFKQIWGQVCLCPSANLQRDTLFVVQGAMVKHCLYHARGMTKWIVHIDVDG